MKIVNGISFNRKMFDRKFLPILNLLILFTIVTWSLTLPSKFEEEEDDERELIDNDNDRKKLKLINTE